MGEKFEALRSLINQHILTPAQDPPQHAQCFETAEDFNNFLRSCPQLKRDMLSGYVRKVPQLRNKDDVSNYLEERGSYRGKTFSDKEVNDAFEKAFNHTNFMWTKNDGDNNRYSRQIHATGDLYTVNLHFYGIIKDLTQSLEKDFANGGIYNKMKARHDPRHLHVLNGKKIPPVSKFIWSSFAHAWQFQADGFQTNATLTPTSIQTLAKFMLEKKLIADGDGIFDCGSSYGSFLLSIVNEIMYLDNKMHVRGYGMEYARIRHTLGSFCFHRMIRLMGSMDYM